jgi:hypothetical protein
MRLLRTNAAQPTRATPKSVALAGSGTIV